MREAYRLNKHFLTTYDDAYFLIGYLYIGPPMSGDFRKVQEKIVSSLHYLNNLHEQI